MPLFIIHYSYRKQGGTCVGTRPPLLKSLRRLCILACKNAEKYAISTLIFENFSGGIVPRPPYWGGATAPLPRLHPPRRSGASRLARDLRSLRRRVWSLKNSLNYTMTSLVSVITFQKSAFGSASCLTAKRCKMQINCKSPQNHYKSLLTV